MGCNKFLSGLWESALTLQKSRKIGAREGSVCGLLAVLPKYKLKLIFVLIFGTEIF